MTASLHTETTSEGQTLSRNKDGMVLYRITYDHDHLNYGRPWRLNPIGAKPRWFRTLEGAQFYALHLEAECGQ